MAKSPEEMEASMIANLEEKTGRSLPEWLELTRNRRESKHGELVKHLKSEHGITHGYANLIAAKTLQTGSADAPVLTEAQYEGAKAALRPIYEAVVAAVRRFGADVEISPKKTYVSLRRKKQFALIQPSTKTRLDVGINLKKEPPTKRLEKSGSFNAMVSHRVRLTDRKEVDAELIDWLRRAYDAS